VFRFLASPVPLSRLIVTAALALAVLGALAPGAGAAYKGRNGELAYEGRASSSGLLLVTGPKGGKPRRIAAPGTPADPAFSPLGRRLAFTSRTEIWVMYADGSGVRQVTVGPEPSRDPTWAPDAARLAFTTGYKGDRDLYRIGADGSGLKRLTTSRLDDEAPAWSSTDLLAFVRHGKAGDGDIAVMKSGGGSVRLLTGSDADDADPAWSPDGRRIVFTRLPKAAPPRKKGKKKAAKRAPHVRELWVMRANGSKARRLATLPAGAGSPVFSPDGRRIAFTMGKYGRRGMYVIRSGDGRGLRRLAAAGSDARSLDWQPRGGDPVIAAAGDIACDPGQPRFASGLGTKDCHMLQTSNLMMRMDLSAVLPLGDLQYEDGTLEKFQQSFDPTWGRLKSLMRPVVGNHEYGSPGAAGYFDYFNGPGVFDGPAGPRDKGYYSYDLGSWHVVTLNSECSDTKAGNPYARDCDAGSPQEQWLRADLAQHRNRCTLALWHHPLFSSGIEARNDHVRPLFQALYESGVDVVLTGHDHGYERFAPMDAAGNRDGALGVRQFVVGTGGKNHQQNRAAQPNSEVRNVTDFGVLEMDLGPTAYRWQFVAEGSRVLDAGANSCH
jgi:Tol biopolymer transport system component